MNDFDREARNAEHKVAEIVGGDWCVYVFRGHLGVDSDDKWIIEPGSNIVVEVYDRAATSIFFQPTDSEARQIAEALL